MYPSHDVGFPVAAWWECGELFGRWRNGRGHECFEGGLVRCVGGAEMSVLAAQFSCCERSEACDALADGGEKGGVAREEVQRVFGVVLRRAGNEEEMDAMKGSVPCTLGHEVEVCGYADLAFGYLSRMTTNSSSYSTILPSGLVSGFSM